ncbi:hypothetical protein [Streptomyces sp. NPDC056549]|uniref:hypothetical protein n=1 Tax=Streptomyces sp. NPDC056549 TaxID=3345864 RepID=UPI0036853D1E
MLRVVRRGGRIACADPGYDAQVLDIEDQVPACRVLALRSDRLLCKGTLANQTAKVLADWHLTQITVTVHALVVLDHTAVDNMGLRTWAAAAADEEWISHSEDGRPCDHFADAIRTGRSTYAVTFFLTPVTVPGDSL